MRLCGQVIKVWGCITACEDRLIITQVYEPSKKECFYLITELSAEVYQTYAYHEKRLPEVIREVIHRCELMRCRVHYDVQRNKKVLYGHHLIRKKRGLFVCELGDGHLLNMIDTEVVHEDSKARIFLTWLQGLLKEE